MLNFEDPAAITKDLDFPDTLEVEFLRPDLVLQAISLNELDDLNTKVTVPLTPQMTAEKYEELVKLNERVEIGSWVLTALEFLCLFFASKVIAQMWSLFLTLQFVAYMIKWQIPIESASSVVLTKLSQIVLGEILDTYGITASATNALGLDYENTDDGISQKVGQDRLSEKTGLLENLGPTFILLLVASVLLIAIAILLSIIA